MFRETYCRTAKQSDINTLVHFITCQKLGMTKTPYQIYEELIET